MTALVITIPGRPPSPNSRRDWHVTARDNRHWSQTAFYAALAVKPPDWCPLERATIEVEFVVPDKRRRDLDNLVSSIKPEIDGIVLAGILRDDSTAVIASMTYSVRMAKGESETVFRVAAA